MNEASSLVHGGGNASCGAAAGPLGAGKLRTIAALGDPAQARRRSRPGNARRLRAPRIWSALARFRISVRSFERRREDAPRTSSPRQTGMCGGSTLTRKDAFFKRASQRGARRCGSCPPCRGRPACCNQISCHVHRTSPTSIDELPSARPRRGPDEQSAFNRLKCRCRRTRQRCQHRGPPQPHAWWRPTYGIPRCRARLGLFSRSGLSWRLPRLHLRHDENLVCGARLGWSTIRL